jgi:hypothetical protein
MTFKKAVESSAPPLNQAYQPGLQALTTYSTKVRCSRPVNVSITGSVDIDSPMARLPQHASANRWDYGVGYKPVKGNECAVWIEVHGANIDEVGTLARKAKWLKDYLRQHAPELWQMTLKSPLDLRYVWLGTKDVHLNMNSPAYRRAAQEGITLHGTVLRLP